MHTNVQTFLKNFEEGKTIKAFSFIGGPRILAPDCQLHTIIKNSEEDYTASFLSATRNMFNEFHEFNTSRTNQMVDRFFNPKTMSPARRELLKDYIDQAWTYLPLGHGYTTIEELPNKLLHDLKYFIATDYLVDNLGLYVEEFFTAYLIKFVLLPMGCYDNAPVEMVTDFFASDNYYNAKPICGGAAGPGPKALVKAFEDFLFESGLPVSDNYER